MSPSDLDQGGGQPSQLFYQGRSLGWVQLPDTVQLSATPIESFGALPGGNPTVNYTAIQNALNQGGVLTLTTPGIYQINQELQIGDNTDLRLAPGVTIKSVVDGKNILVTKAIAVTPSSVALAWAGTDSSLVTVTWTNHGLVAGDAVSISGANQSTYTGVFVVKSVTNVNVFTFDTVRVPYTSPTGTIVAKKCNSRVYITGGTWDRNTPPFGGGTALQRACIWFGYVYDGRVQDVKCQNYPTFAVHSGVLRDVEFKNITSANGTGEVCKVYGPAFGVKINGIYGTCGDDGCSFQTREFNAFIDYRWTVGDIIGCTANDIYACSGSGAGSGAACYCSTNEVMDEVHYSNIYSTVVNSGALFFLDGGAETGIADNVTISGIKGWTGGNPITIQRCTVRNLVIRDAEPIPFSTPSGNLVDVIVSATINQLTLEDVFISPAVSWSGTFYLIQNFGNIDTATVRNVNAKSTGKLNVIRCEAGSALKTADLYGITGNFSTGDIVTLFSAIGTPRINYHGGRIEAADSLVYFHNVNGSVGIFGTVIESVAGGVIISDTSATISGVIAGARLDSGPWTKSFGGVPVYTVSVLTPTSLTITNPTLETAWRFDTSGISAVPTSGVNFIGQQSVSYIQFDKPGVIGLFDWASAQGGTFSGSSRTPAQITSNQNNYNPGGYSFFQRWTSDAARDVTGLTFTSPQEDGEVHIVVNEGAFNIVLKFENASSAAANRFSTNTGADITLVPGDWAMLMYNSNRTRWSVIKLT